MGRFISAFILTLGALGLSGMVWLISTETSTGIETIDTFLFTNPTITTTETSSQQVTPTNQYTLNAATYTAEASSGRALFALTHPTDTKKTYVFEVMTHDIALTVSHTTSGNPNITGTVNLDMETFNLEEPATTTEATQLLATFTSNSFFATKTHPTAQLRFISISPITGHHNQFTVQARLSFRGETHDLSFPATVFMKDTNTLEVNIQTEIDRTMWGMLQGSPKLVGKNSESTLLDQMRFELQIQATI